MLPATRRIARATPLGRKLCLLLLLLLNTTRTRSGPPSNFAIDARRAR